MKASSEHLKDRDHTRTRIPSDLGRRASMDLIELQNSSSRMKMGNVERSSRQWTRRKPIGDEMNEGGVACPVRPDGGLQSGTMTDRQFFAAGSQTETDSGPCLIESLRAGDRLRTYEGDLVRVTFASRFQLGPVILNEWPALRPILIEEGVIGNERRIHVSPLTRLADVLPLIETGQGRSVGHVPRAIDMVGRLPGVRVERDTDQFSCIMLGLEWRREHPRRGSTH